jgi:hypothetical protein
VFTKSSLAAATTLVNDGSKLSTKRFDILGRDTDVCVISVE